MIIKKLNSLFHKHARVLFGAFAVIIIIAFMDFLTPGRSGCAGTNPADIKVGSAFGKDVTYGDLQKTGDNLQVFARIAGQDFRPENRDLFYIYCLMERAEQMGIFVSEKEAGEAVKNLPFFQKDGKFDVAIYKDFCSKNMVSDNDVINAVKFSIIQRKLMEAVAGAVSVSDKEIEMFYRTNFPKFTVRVKELQAAAFLNSVKAAKDADLQKYLTANAAKYMIPAKISALIVELPFANFRAEAAKSIKDADIDRLVEPYRNMKDDKGKPMDLAKIKKDMRDNLVDQKARQLAGKKINDFARKAYQSMEKVNVPGKRIALFRGLAAQNGFTVIETGVRDFDPSGIAGVNSTAFMADLKSMPVANCTRLMPTEKGFAIGYLINRIPERQKSLAEAKKSGLINDYKLAEARKIAAAKADEYSKAIKKDKKKALAVFNGIKGKESKLVFSQHDFAGQPDSAIKDKLNLAGALYSEISLLMPGEFTGAITLADGSAIACLTGRSAADMKKFDALKGQIKYMLEAQKRQSAMQDFEQNLMRQCRYDLEERNPRK